MTGKFRLRTVPAVMELMNTRMMVAEHGRLPGLFTALTPATYNVQIRDKAHTACIKILDAALVITEPAMLNATVNNTNVTCFGAMTEQLQYLHLQEATAVMGTALMAEHRGRDRATSQILLPEHTIYEYAMQSIQVV